MGEADNWEADFVGSTRKTVETYAINANYNYAKQMLVGTDAASEGALSGSEGGPTKGQRATQPTRKMRK